MGSKFCNLNIYCNDTSVIDTILAPNMRTYRCAERWITVTSPSFEWGSTQGYAKSISKELSCPVLSTEYFDDDYVEFALYSGGKLITKHIPATYEDFRKKKANAKKLIECLSLNIVEEASLKKLLAVDDCEESVHLMESYLGCPIFGIKDGWPPESAPDRTVFETFAGGKTDVTIEVRKNPATINVPPYAMEPDSLFISGKKLDESIICFTDKPEPIIRKIELWHKRFREDKEGGIFHPAVPQSDVLDGHDVDIVVCKDRVVLQGLYYGAWGVADLSKEFKCLTLVVYTGATAFLRYFECALGYSGKCIFRSSRGTAGPLTPSVVPNVILDGPFLTLKEGELVKCFEAERIDDAISSMERLFAAPIHPIDPEHYTLIKTGDHIRVFAPPHGG